LTSIEPDRDSSAMELDDVRALFASAKQVEPREPERVRTLIEAQVDRDLETLLRAFVRLRDTLARAGHDLFAEIDIDPQNVRQLAADFFAHAAGASPDRKQALIALALRRLDPRVPRGLRAFWFTRFSPLNDHELEALQLLDQTPITLLLDQKRALRLTWFAYLDRCVQLEEPLTERDMLDWSEETFATYTAILRSMANAHRDLVEAIDTGYATSASYALTIEGRILTRAIRGEAEET
jgi:hypothetical protein